VKNNTTAKRPSPGASSGTFSSDSMSGNRRSLFRVGEAVAEAEFVDDFNVIDCSFAQKYQQ
jgi:hypothetical protein